MNLEARAFNALLEYLKHDKLWKRDLFIRKKTKQASTVIYRVNT